MDLNPAAVEAAVEAIHDRFNLYYGQPVDEKTVFTRMAEAAYPIIAAAVARATADAIADQIEALPEWPVAGVSQERARIGGWVNNMRSLTAGIARSFGSTAPEGPKP